MECASCQAQLLSYLENPDDSSIVADHLQTCPACREALDEVEEQLRLFHQEAASVPSAAIDFHEVFQTAVSQKEKPAFFHNKRLAAAAVIPAGAAAFFLWPIIFSEDPGAHSAFDHLDHVIDEDDGLRVNVEERTDDLRFLITDVVADESQLHLYYEAENLQGEQSFVPMYYGEGFTVENLEDVWDMTLEDDHERHISTEDHTILEENEDGVRGRIALPAPDYESGSLQLRFDNFSSPEQMTEFETLNAGFTMEIPFQRIESRRYDLHDTEIIINEDNSYILEQMQVGPAATELFYRETTENQGDQLRYHHPASISTETLSSTMISDHRNISGGPQNTIVYESLFYEDMSALEFTFDDYLQNDQDFFEEELDFQNTNTAEVTTPLGEVIIEQASETEYTVSSPDEDNLNTSSVLTYLSDGDQSYPRAEEQPEILISDKHHDTYSLENISQITFSKLEVPLSHESDVIYNIETNDQSNVHLHYNGFSERVQWEESVEVQPRRIDE